MKKVLLLLAIILSLSNAFSCDMLAFLNKDGCNPATQTTIYNNNINSLVDESLLLGNVNGWGYTTITQLNANVDDVHRTIPIYNDTNQVNILKTKLANSSAGQGTIIHARKTTILPALGGVHPYLWEKSSNMGERSISFAHNGTVARQPIFNLLDGNHHDWFEDAYAHVNNGAQLPNSSTAFVDSELAFYLLIFNYEKYQDIKSAMYETINTINDLDNSAVFNFFLMEGYDRLYAYRCENADDDHKIGYQNYPDLFLTSTFEDSWLLSNDALLEIGTNYATPKIYSSFADYNLEFTRSYVQGWNYVSFPVLPEVPTVGNVFYLAIGYNFIDKIMLESGEELTGSLMINHEIDSTKGIKVLFNTPFSNYTIKGAPVDPTTTYTIYAGQQYYIPYIKNQYRNLLPPTHQEALGQALYDSFSYLSPADQVHFGRLKPTSTITSWGNGTDPQIAKNGSMYIIQSFKNAHLQWDGNSGLFRSQEKLPQSEIILPNLQNITIYPNPFNPETTIRFNMSKAGNANVAVYNLKGQLVKTVLSGNITAGNKEVVWNGTDAQNNNVSSGVYFLRVKTDNQTINKKMVLQK